MQGKAMGFDDARSQAEQEQQKQRAGKSNAPGEGCDDPHPHLSTMARALVLIPN